VAYESISELFGVVIDVLGEVEHDGDPNIVGSDFHIAVVVVGAEKGAQKTVGVWCSVSGFAGLLIGEKLC
jgi:hypothetical protein